MLDALKVLAVIAVFVLASVAALLAAPDNDSNALACVTGEDARNPTQTSPTGQVITMPTNRTFDTIEEAERWICLDVPQAELLPDWEVATVAAQRSHSLEGFTGGMGFRMMTIDYWNDSLGVRITVDTPWPSTDIVGAGSPEEIQVQGKAGTLWLRDDMPLWRIQWGEGNESVMATGALVNGVDLERDILPFLETVR